MKNQRYHFKTSWRLQAPLNRVWPVLVAVKEWPKWWRGMQFVKIVQDNGLAPGSKLEFWLTPLPWYHLGITLTFTVVDAAKRVEAHSEGDLLGTGIATLREQDGISSIDFDWNVETTEWWMNRFAFALRPFFTFMHHLVLRWGALGLAKRIDAPLISVKRIQ